MANPAPIDTAPIDPASVNLASYISEHACVRPRALAIQAGESSLNYQALEARVQSVAAGFRSLGLGPGDVLAVQLPNSLEFVVALLAANRIGAVTQTVHMPYRRAELSSLLAHSQARAFIGAAQFKDFSPAQTVLSLRTDAAMPAGSVQHVIAVGDAVPGSLAWTSLAQFPPDSTPCPVNIDAPYVLLYTSGTTTSPKGILTPARRFVHNACQAVVELNITERDVVLSAAPFPSLWSFCASMRADRGCQPQPDARLFSDRSHRNGQARQTDHDLRGSRSLQAPARPRFDAPGRLCVHTPSMSVGHHGTASAGQSG
jgi:acyl-coenzyme A synthetase/AMP-(fatty) acid ligase